LEGGVVHVGGVDTGAVVEPGLLQQDGHREGLLACGAAGVPHSQERVRPQEGDDLGPEDAEEPRVPEHGADVDRQVAEQTLHGPLVVEDPVEEAGDARQSLGLDPTPDAPAERRARVVPEVEAVGLVDAVRQQVDLDGLQVSAAQRLAILSHSPYGTPTTRVLLGPYGRNGAAFGGAQLRATAVELCSPPLTHAATPA